MSHSELVEEVNKLDQLFMHDKAYSAFSSQWMNLVDDAMDNTQVIYLDDLDNWDLELLLKQGEEFVEYNKLMGKGAGYMSGGIWYEGTVREVRYLRALSGWYAKVQLFGGNPDNYFNKPVDEFEES